MTAFPGRIFIPHLLRASRRGKEEPPADRLVLDKQPKLLGGTCIQGSFPPQRQNFPSFAHAQPPFGVQAPPALNSGQAGITFFTTAQETESRANLKGQISECGVAKRPSRSVLAQRLSQVLLEESASPTLPPWEISGSFHLPWHRNDSTSLQLGYQGRNLLPTVKDGSLSLCSPYSQWRCRLTGDSHCASHGGRGPLPRKGTSECHL